MDKIALMRELKRLREDREKTTDPAKLELIQLRGWQIRKILGLSRNPKIEKRQLAALEAAERERQKGAA